MLLYRRRELEANVNKINHIFCSLSMCVGYPNYNMQPQPNTSLFDTLATNFGPHYYPDYTGASHQSAMDRLVTASILWVGKNDISPYFGDWSFFSRLCTCLDRIHCTFIRTTWIGWANSYRRQRIGSWCDHTTIRITKTGTWNARPTNDRYRFE